MPSLKPAITAIGSRETPGEMLQKMNTWGQKLSEHFELRSGNAPGADQEWLRQVPDQSRAIFLPDDGFFGLSHDPKKGIWSLPQFNNWQNAAQMASFIHPQGARWAKCSTIAELKSDGFGDLMTRNVYQLLGHDLASPSIGVLCWTPSAEIDDEGLICNVSGGTGGAVRLAYKHQVPVAWIACKKHQAWLERWLSHPQSPFAPPALTEFDLRRTPTKTLVFRK